VSRPIGDFIDVGDRVILRYNWRGIGRGPESNVEATCVFTVRAGKVLNIEHFWVTRRLSKPPACRSKTLTPTPEACGILRGR
jgi:hypothetical protein